MSATETTKEKMLEAATVLFTSKGYHGTSIREIASKTGVNISLISYYFGGKQGLLEALMTDFLEGYMEELELAVKTPHHDSYEKMLYMAERVLTFMKERHLRARFVLREMTLDSTLIREITSTYLMKEKHLYSIVLKKGIQEGTFAPVSVQWTIMQFRGMVIMPYLHHQYVREVFHLHPQQPHFIKMYRKELREWASKVLLSDSKKEEHKAIPFHHTQHQADFVQP
ncbi:transcriptional regulator, TetR family [Alteribacillus persepolensis]|uniref:Transcriptional regulator, TetR family n=1 Tax=Alteribacillus persepolensis TaxID=568899 RepID=A0A1G8BEU5_9BACI|nr:forespore capture DNA-binding protein RefZ [Alteribacillus persepolensis]SDH31688.1 transcriptional regulator, TetR family [Alteribacillus persepolensis]